MKTFFTGTLRGRIVLNIARNIQNAIFLKPGTIVGNASSVDVDKAYTYAKQVFDDYLKMLPAGGSSIQGKDILELGPGGNALVAYRMIHAGAKEVYSADKYKFMINPEVEVELLKRLQDELQFSENAGGMHRMMHDCPVEELDKEFYVNSFDLIVSRAVLEYVHDLEQSIEKMYQILKPGGLMVHKIDFRDDGLFSDLGLHPLHRLTLPRWLYCLMTSKSYKPTLNLLDDYLEKLESAGFATTYFVTYILGHDEEITPHTIFSEINEELLRTARENFVKFNHRLSKKQRARAERNYLITGAYLISEKESVDE